MSPEISSLRHITLPELVEGLNKKTYTSTDLVNAYSARIAQVNPTFNAVIELAPSVLRSAELLDASRPAHSSNPLYGVPIFLKDNIPTLDGTDTTCGSAALIGAQPAKEAAVVTALCKAGAIIMGKANMAEWSGFRSTSGCSGWSARGGQCTGVFYPGMKASGSSSGCAVAVALGLCFAAIGTETCYSIVSPAERSGIIGYKPTRGIISSEGIISTSERIDAVGVLARNVADATSIVADIVRHSTHHDTATQAKLLNRLNPRWLQWDITGYRIGIPWKLDTFANVDITRLMVFSRLLKYLTQAGATVVPKVVLPGEGEYDGVDDAEKNLILDTEMKAALNQYLSSLVENPNKIENLGDLINFTKSHSNEEYPARNVAVLERAEKTDVNDPRYISMCEQETSLIKQRGIDAALKSHKCDVLLVPCLSTTIQTLAARAGSPNLSVPIGCYDPDQKVMKDKQNGLVNIGPEIPFSVYLYGESGFDMGILTVASAIEKRFRVRSALTPYLLPTVEIEHVLGKQGT